MEQKLDLIIESIKELQQITRSILDRQDETDAKLEALTMDVHQMQGTITAIQHDISSMQSTITIMQNDISSMQGTITIMQHDISSIQGSIITLQEGQQRIEKSLARQDTILGMLSTRSLEQEADITRLKQAK